jgi:hypothetical protein
MSIKYHVNGEKKGKLRIYIYWWLLTLGIKVLASWMAMRDITRYSWEKKISRKLLLGVHEP